MKLFLTPLDNYAMEEDSFTAWESIELFSNYVTAGLSLNRYLRCVERHGQLM